MRKGESKELIVLYFFVSTQVTKFMYLGLPKSSTDSVNTFADAMADEKQEWFLMACLDELETGCDFSKADPTSM